MMFQLLYRLYPFHWLNNLKSFLVALLQFQVCIVSNLVFLLVVLQLLFSLKLDAKNTLGKQEYIYCNSVHLIAATMIGQARAAITAIMAITTINSTNVNFFIFSSFLLVAAQLGFEPKPYTFRECHPAN